MAKWRSHFNDEWYEEDLYKDWVQRVAEDDNKFYCKFCEFQGSLSNTGKKALLTHYHTKKHQMNDPDYDGPRDPPHNAPQKTQQSASQKTQQNASQKNQQNGSQKTPQRNQLNKAPQKNQPSEPDPQKKGRMFKMLQLTNVYFNRADF